MMLFNQSVYPSAILRKLPQMPAPEAFVKRKSCHRRIFVSNGFLIRSRAFETIYYYSLIMQIPKLLRRVGSFSLLPQVVICSDARSYIPRRLARFSNSSNRYQVYFSDPSNLPRPCDAVIDIRGNLKEKGWCKWI